MKLYAIVAKQSGPYNPEELVGLNINGQNLPCVSTKKHLVEAMFTVVSPEVKGQGARIVEFAEVPWEQK